MRRKLLIAAAATGALLMLLAFLALYTNLGLQLALQLASRWVPGSLQVGAASGRLAGPVQLQQVRFQSPGLTLSVGRLNLDWRPQEIFSRSLDVVDFGAANIEVRLLPSTTPPDASAFELPALATDWGVRLEGGRIDGLRVIPRSGAPIEFERIDLDAELAAGVVTLKIAASDARGRWSASGDVDTRLRYRHRLNLNFEPAQAGREIRIASEGDQDSLQILAQADEWDARVDATIIDPLGELQWRGSVAARVPGVEGLTASGGGSLTQAELSAELTSGGRRINVKAIRLEWTGGVLRVVDSVVEIPGIMRRVELRGTMTPEADPRFDIALTALADIGAAPLDKYLQAATASLTIAGTLSSARLQGTGRLTTTRGALDLDLDATGDSGGLDPLRVEVTQAEGALRLLGAISWRDGLDWRFDLDGAGLDPSLIWPGWQAGLDVVGRSTGRVHEGKIDALVEFDRIGGSFLGSPIAGKAKARLSGDGLEALDTDLQVADSRITARGQWALQRGGEVNAEIVDLGQVLPGASGALQGRLNLTDSGQGLSLSANVSGSGLSWEQLRIAEIGLDAASSAILDGLTSAELRASGLDYAGVQIKTLELTAAGPWIGLAARARADVADLGQVSLAAVVDAADQGRSGRLEQLDWNSEDYGAWSLREAAAYRLLDSGWVLDTACLDRQPGLVCAGASAGPEGQHWNIQVRQLPAELAQVPLSIALDRPLRLSGELSGAAQALMGGDTVAQLAGDLEARDLSLSMDFGGGWRSLMLGATQVTVSGDGGGLQGTATTASDIFSMALEASLRDPLSASGATLEGRLRVDVPELAAVASFFSLPVEIGGRGHAELSFSGSPDAPELGGRMELSEVVFEAAEYGSRWRNGRLEALLEGGQRLRISGNIDAEKGAVSVEGQADYATGQARLKLTGDEVRVARTPSLLLEISPDLEFTAGAPGYALRGTLDVVTAEIEEFDTDQSVSRSPDVVVVDEAGGEPAEEALALTTDIRVRFKNPAELDAYGMTAQLSGELRVVDTPGEAVLATGELRVGGSYQAYGQDLTIEEGRLIYAQTPLDNPSIRASAYRQVGEVRAGVRVSGRAAEPQLSLYSTPAMSDNEILSYLILGRASTAGGDLDGNAMVTNAALQLGLSQGNNVVGQVGSKLGFDQLSIGVDEEFGGAAVSIGRYLSPRLYLSYSTGLVQAIDLLRFEYRLGKRWSIQSEIGVQTRTTIGYEIETGRPKEAAETGH